MKRSLEMPVADGRTDGQGQIYRTPVGSAEDPINSVKKMSFTEEQMLFTNLLK